MKFVTRNSSMQMFDEHIEVVAILSIRIINTTRRRVSNVSSAKLQCGNDDLHDYYQNYFKSISKPLSQN